MRRSVGSKVTVRSVIMCLAGVSLASVALLAQGATAGAEPGTGQGANGPKQPQFDGVYGVELAAEKSPSGKPRWIVVRLYEDGTSVEAEFFGGLTDCASWLSRDNERLIPGRWRMDGEALTVLESSGLVESERSGTLGTAGWATTPRVRVTFENGWQLEPVDRVGGPEIVFAFQRVTFEAGRTQEPGNRRPMFQGFGSFARHYDYDRAGNLKSISEELTVDAVDLDQDPLSFAWTVSSGSVTGEGPKARWQRVLVDGRPEPGNIGIEVSDGRGGRLAFAWNTDQPIARGWALYSPSDQPGSQDTASGP